MTHDLRMPLDLRSLWFMACIFLSGCAESDTITNVGQPSLQGPHAKVALHLLKLADRDEQAQLSSLLRKARYFNWVEGEQRPSGRPAQPKDIYKSIEGPCTIESLIEYVNYQVQAKWACDAYDIELSLRFRFDTDGEQVAIEREIPKWVTEV